MRPPCRLMMRRTVARPTPVPSNSATECSRWNTPNSLSAYFMSNPAPLSRTMNARVPFTWMDPNSIRGCACFAVYFQLLRRRLSRATRSKRRSEEHTSELQSLAYLVCRLLLEKKNNDKFVNRYPCGRLYVLAVLHAATLFGSFN